MSNKKEIYLNLESIIEDIIVSLESFKDEKRIKVCKSYIPTTKKVYGVSSPKLEMIFKELKSIVKSTNSRQKIKLAKDLVFTNIFECSQIAYMLIGKDKSIIQSLTKTDVDELAFGIDNWASVDTYSIFILGKALREGVVDTNHIINLYQSDNIWTRRSAIVATVSLNLKSQGGKGDAPRTLEICKLVVQDHHDLINKALSWALRELSKTNKQAVVHFLEYYDHALHARVKREVSNKLKTGLKNPK